jgi:antitoxin HicB
LESFAYPATLKKSAEGGFVVCFPDVPEALTQGSSRAETLARAVDALETALEFYTESNEALPQASKQLRGQVLVRPPALSCMKLAVYAAMIENKIRKTELSRRLGWHLMQVDRLLNLKHASRIDQVEAALGALNRQITIQVQRRAA